MARQSPLLPDLGEVAPNHMRLLGPVLTNGRPPEYYEQMRALAATMGRRRPEPRCDLPAQPQCRLARLGGREHRPHEVSQWATLFRQFDVVLARRCRPRPSSTIPPNQRPPPRRRRQGQPYNNNIKWAAPATVARLPATVAPIASTETGLPIGVQIIGPYLEDATPIQFAQLLERAFGGFVPPVL